MSWRLGLGLVLLLAAVLSGWSAWKQRAAPIAAAPAAERSDYVMRDFEMTRLDAKGLESVSLRAPEMQRSAQDRTLQISRPVFQIPDSEGLHWEMRSNSAWVSAKADEVRLQGNVEGRSPEAAAVPTTFKTESLNVFPRKHLVTTPEAVTITRPGSILRGVGLEVDTQTRQYTLLSQVKTRYEPKSAR